MKEFKGTKKDWSRGVVFDVPDARKGQKFSNIKSQNSDLLVAKVFGKDEDQARANANLIAAAPDLLEKGIALLDKYLNEFYRGQNDVMEKEVKELSEAIKKALGQ